jgi:methylase of polypeptide subunit release factors
MPIYIFTARGPCRMSESRRLEVFYTLHPWIEDLETYEGLKRYREVVELMERVTSHPWFRELVESRKRIKIIDVCSGTGIGGIALSRVLRDRGVEVALTLVDLRLSALEKGRKFAVRELGFEPLIVTADVTQPLDLE